MDIKKVLIEFIITFAIIYVIYYFMIIRKCRKNKKVVPAEVNLILSFYNINLKKVDIYQIVKVVSVVTTFILSLIITIISVFFESTIILLLFGTLISIIVAIICYRIIGRYYEKQSMKKEKK
jgi:hypothetical protein